MHYKTPYACNVPYELVDNPYPTLELTVINVTMKHKWLERLLFEDKQRVFDAAVRMRRFVCATGVVGCRQHHNKYATLFA
jgi:hypothetical protein